jgi:hypothetical protein
MPYSAAYISYFTYYTLQFRIIPITSQVVFIAHGGRRLMCRHTAAEGQLKPKAGAFGGEGGGIL